MYISFLNNYISNIVCVLFIRFILSLSFLPIFASSSCDFCVYKCSVQYITFFSVKCKIYRPIVLSLDHHYFLHLALPLGPCVESKNDTSQIIIQALTFEKTRSEHKERVPEKKTGSFSAEKIQFLML